MSAILNTIAYLQNLALECGAKNAPAKPSEASLVFPFAATYPLSLRLIAGRLDGESILDVEYVTDFAVNRANLPLDVTRVAQFLEDFSRRLRADLTLGGNAVRVVAEGGLASANVIAIDYGGITCLAARFRLRAWHEI